jgi:hypothetical protein
MYLSPGDRLKKSAERLPVPDMYRPMELWQNSCREKTAFKSKFCTGFVTQAINIMLSENCAALLVVLIFYLFKGAFNFGISVYKVL